MQIYLAESQNVIKIKKVSWESAESTHQVGKWLLSQRFPSFLFSLKRRYFASYLLSR